MEIDTTNDNERNCIITSAQLLTLKNLKSLGLHFPSYYDFSHCQSALTSLESSLEQVHLAGMKKLSWNPFHSFVLLTSLTLEKSRIHTLEGLENLNKLEKLELLNILECSDFSPIGRNKNIKSITLEDANGLFMAFDGFDNIVSPQNLTLRNCLSLENIDSFQNLSSLKRLEIRQCPSLEDLNGFKSLTFLQTLKLVQCSMLGNLKVFKNVTTLKSLTIYNCNLRLSFDSPMSLTTLDRLSLGHTGMDDLSALKTISTLQTLKLHFINPFSTVERQHSIYLEALMSLEKIDTFKIVLCSKDKGVSLSFIIDMIRQATSVQELELWTKPLYTYEGMSRCVTGYHGVVESLNEILIGTGYFLPALQSFLNIPDMSIKKLKLIYCPFSDGLTAAANANILSSSDAPIFEDLEYDIESLD
eukprot:Awhi_evm1s1940